MTRLQWYHIHLYTPSLSVQRYNKTNNQRTNGPVNAHLISGPRISTKHTKPGKKQGQKMTLNFNTHLLSTELVVCNYNFQATGCNSLLSIHCFPIFHRKALITKFDLVVKLVKVTPGSSFEQAILRRSLRCYIPSFLEIDLPVPAKKICEGFFHIWAWRPSWSCDQHHINKFPFPCT